MQHWKTDIESRLVDLAYDRVPECFPIALHDQNWRKLRSEFIHALNDDAIIGATIGFAKDWTKDSADEIIAWVKAKLEIPAEAP